MLNPQMNSRGAVKHRPRPASVAEPTISPDSLLEGSGFEPSVPLGNVRTVGAERDIGRRKRRFLYGGTDGSNPVPSSGESDANLWPGHCHGRFCQSGTGQFDSISASAIARPTLGLVSELSRSHLTVDRGERSHSHRAPTSSGGSNSPWSDFRHSMPFS